LTKKSELTCRSTPTRFAACELIVTHEREPIMINSIEEIIAEIDALEDIVIQCKSLFPALSDNLVGKDSFPTPPFYRSRGHDAYIRTEKPITQKFINQYLKVGKWLNENAIIRLYGIMYYHGLLKKIDSTVNGWKEVDLMRRMRDAFTKTKLNYKPNDPRNTRLRKEVISYFDLPEAQFPEGEIPTPIDKVIRLIFEGCRNYVRGKKDKV
jgi:hypothetical protein